MVGGNRCAGWAWWAGGVMQDWVGWLDPLQINRVAWRLKEARTQLYVCDKWAGMARGVVWCSG